MAALQARINGRVQGVGFRFFTRSKAVAYGLNGYVRNLPDGGVEVVAKGPKKMLGHLLADLERGPAGSRVDDCRVEWFADLNLDAGFAITY